jgi:ADP-dependent NAD(P)H-hydrate dehydratase / NAD(P)H-hydrate epimerase
MAVADENPLFLTSSPRLSGTYNVIGAGPGIGTKEETQQVLKNIIQYAPGPLVIDADAINILSENKTWLHFVPAQSIYTPHPKEFERLAGKWNDDFERLRLQVMFSVKYGVYVVLKGAHTSVTCPDGRCYFNSTGNPGMATAGSGDVLTGIITGLKAQGYGSGEAAIMGVYLHGLAGDIALRSKGENSLIAGDIIEALPEAFLTAENY